MINYQNFKKLFQKYLENQCTPEEAETVLAWLESEEYSQEQKELISGLLSGNPEVGKSITEALQQRLQKSFKNTLQKIEEKENTGGKLKKFVWLWYAAAAVLLILVGSGTYWLLQLKVPAKNTAMATYKEKTNEIKKDLAPGSNKAVLTLADGSTIVLDDAENGILTQQGNTKVVKVNGKLAYDPANTKNSEILYNTISTPRGGQYQIELPDGSQVWLNSLSSLHFPAAFAGKERRVEITGEAYFEVAKNAAMPFKVAIVTPTGDVGEIEVLGTHFNVMAYNDEAEVKATLLKGSIKINQDRKTVVIKPGQQARLQHQSIQVTDDVDIEEVMAWKNGYFQFNAASLQQVMRQIARWYDVEISYEGKVPERRFGGKISRDNNASEVLRVLELSKVKFRIEDKKIIVTSQP
ncbi:MAG: FecR domain-containing protein [Bacteroidota bacterium]